MTLETHKRELTVLRHQRFEAQSLTNIAHYACQLTETHLKDNKIA